MVLILGTFLLNALCAVVPCYPIYESPAPVPVPPPLPPHFQGRGPPLKSSNNGKSASAAFARTVPHPQQIHHPPPSVVIVKQEGVQNPAPAASSSAAASASSSSTSGVIKEVKIPILKSPYVVSTQSGKVEGFLMKTIRSREIIAFTGIPYAEPPMGYLRYRDPVPKRPWSGVLKASTTPSDCMQIDGMQLLRIVGHSDCLYLNVYTPILPSADVMRSANVILFIHGGSFAFGSGSAYGPAYLLEKNVVLVTFNYRLSSFGFLSTGDDAASGNFGLKDQRLVLKWVHANIASFGGDPNNIILVGQSAGAVSAHLHMMSEQSQGLFKAAISHSGNALTFWGARQQSIDFRLANSLHCPVNDSYALVDCMRKLDPNLIAYHEATLPEYKVFPGVFFGPIVEHAGSENAFLTEKPEKLYEDGKVAAIPWINGFLAGEGNGVSFLTWLYPFVMREVDSRWTELGPKILDIKGEIRHTSKTAAFIKNFYFGDHPINFYSRHRLSQMVGDRLIVSAIYKGLQLHSKIAPTYGYFFNFTGRYGTASIYGLENKDWGISHDDDLLYLFNSTTYQSLKLGDPEYKFSEFLINVWTNFATYGEPIFKTSDDMIIRFWKPVNSSSSTNNATREIQVVSFNGDAPKMIDIPFRNRIKIWEKLNLVSNSEVKGFPVMPAPVAGTVEKVLITSHYKEENGDAKLRVSYNSKNLTEV